MLYFSLMRYTGQGHCPPYGFKTQTHEKPFRVEIRHRPDARTFPWTEVFFRTPPSKISLPSPGLRWSCIVECVFRRFENRQACCSHWAKNRTNLLLPPSRANRVPRHAPWWSQAQFSASLFRVRHENLRTPAGQKVVIPPGLIPVSVYFAQTRPPISLQT